MRSEKRKATDKAYWSSEKGKASRKAYNASEKGRASRKAYSTSEKGKATRSSEKAAKKVSHLKRRYGLTEAHYNTLLDGQGFLCAICLKPDLEDNKPLHIDHCHATRRIRGLLCNGCNTGLGLFKENASNLERAAKYVHRNSLILAGDETS